MANENKTIRNDASVDEFLASVADIRAKYHGTGKADE